MVGSFNFCLFWFTFDLLWDLYWSPSQANDEYESCLKSFEVNLDKINEENPIMISALGDFKPKSSNLCKNDSTSHEGPMIDAVANNYGLYQLIHKLMHILNLSSSCIDLIFNSQTNLVMESGVHSYLHSNCHYEVVFAKLNVCFISTILETNCLVLQKTADAVNLSIGLLMNLSW